MDYVKLQFTHPGIMGFIEKQGDDVIRYTDPDGLTISPTFDQTIGIQPLYPKWGLGGMAYAYVSFVSGSLIAYQDTSGSLYSEDGSPLTYTYLRQNNFTENHLLDEFPPKPDWGV